MKDFKKNIPNILTLSRLVLTPVIIVLGLVFNQYQLVIILSSICALTDLFDGKLARKWNVTSEKGAKLDASADKIFSIGLILCLIRKVRSLFIILILELVIAGYNSYNYYKKTHHTNTLMVGKCKATTLYLAIISSMICVFVPQIVPVRSGFIYATINLQIITIISYISYYYNYEDEEALTRTRKMSRGPKKIYDYDLEKTKKIDNLKELI